MTGKQRSRSWCSMALGYGLAATLRVTPLQGVEEAIICAFMRVSSVRSNPIAMGQSAWREQKDRCTFVNAPAFVVSVALLQGTSHSNLFSTRHVQLSLTNSPSRKKETIIITFHGVGAGKWHPTLVIHDTVRHGRKTTMVDSSNGENGSILSFKSHFVSKKGIGILYPRVAAVWHYQHCVTALA